MGRPSLKLPASERRVVLTGPVGEEAAHRSGRPQRGGWPPPLPTGAAHRAQPEKHRPPTTPLPRSVQHDTPIRFAALIQRRKAEDWLASPRGRASGRKVTPAGQPFIFLITGESGAVYGYEDGWENDGTFRYYGEGQVGEMQFVRGNTAIRDHSHNGKDCFSSKKRGPRTYAFSVRWSVRPMTLRTTLPTVR
jgi:hypothetical protein